MATLRRAELLPKWEGSKVDFPNYRWWRAPSKSFRAVRRLPIDTIVIHATAGGSSVGAMSVTQKGTASWHALIPDEDELGHSEFIYRCVADENAAWHVLSSVEHPVDGKRNINDRSFGVEIVNWQTNDDKFSDWQVKVTADLVRYWWSNYNIKYLYTHAYLDPKRKSDPGHLFPWDKFMGYIMAKVDEPKPLTVTVDGVAMDLGIWLDKGTSYGPVKRIWEASGGSVDWDGANNTLKLKKRS